MSGAFAQSWCQHNFNLPGLVFWGVELLPTPLKITEGPQRVSASGASHLVDARAVFLRSRSLWVAKSSSPPGAGDVFRTRCCRREGGSSALAESLNLPRGEVSPSSPSHGDRLRPQPSNRAFWEAASCSCAPNFAQPQTFSPTCQLLGYFFPAGKPHAGQRRPHQNH